MKTLDVRAWDGTGFVYFDLYADSSIDFHEFNISIENNTELELWSGLVDKNNVKIYEGDIIKEEVEEYGTSEYLVKFDDTFKCFTLKCIHGINIHDELWQINKTTKVIGNIHERYNV